jgi:CDP-diacylglycerol---serine O-phosphatidyltransferase
MKRHLPNIITLGNLTCGLLAIQAAFVYQYEWALYWIAGGLFLDFFDGFAARLLKVSGELGKQLDSLADMVTFGVAPGLIIYHLLEQLILIQLISPSDSPLLPNYVDAYVAAEQLTTSPIRFIPYIGFLIPLMSAVRLARFNISTNQTDEFIGLPTPANALFFASLPVIIQSQSNLGIWFGNLYILLPILLLFVVLLNANIPLIALKFKTFGWKENIFRYNLLIGILLTISSALLINSIFTAIPIIILLYLIISIIKNIISNKSNI